MPDSKPSWDTSIPGRNDSLRTSRATKEEIDAFAARRREAVSLASGMGAAFLSREGRFLADREREITVAESSLAMFLDESRDVEDRQEKIEAQRRALATALYQSGRSDEALFVIAEGSEEERASLAGLRSRIIAVADAVDRDDDLTHECDRESAEIEAGPQRTAAVRLDRRAAVEEIYSLHHRSLVSVWRCRVCGDLNATKDAPERQARYEEMRATAHRIEEARRAGAPVPAPYGFDDAQLLKR